MKDGLAKQANNSKDEDVFMKRWISGLILAPILVAFLIYAQPVAVQLVIIALALVGFHEFFNMTLGHQKSIVKNLGFVIVLTTLISFVYLENSRDNYFLIFSIQLILSFMIHFSGNAEPSQKLKELTFFYFGLAYITLLFGHWILLLNLDHWHFWFFIMLACTFMSDTGGYVFGKWLGKHQLAPQLSPKKTIEGFLGGVLAAIIGGLVVRQIFWPEFSLPICIAMSVCISFLGPIGDLSESLIKRGVNAKDSGVFLPGHGGLLDRVDALLFSGVLVYHFARFVL